MIYILYSAKTYNHAPEINYGGGVTIPVRKGYFLFNEEHTTEYYFHGPNSTIFINDEQCHIQKRYSFTNPIKAEILYLKLKIEESKQSSFDFFFPTSFSKYVIRFNELKEEFPEYVL